MDAYTVEQAQALPIAARRTGRKMRTTEEKLRIVQETLQPGSSVATVARRHGVNANLLFTWRRQYEQGVLAEHTRSPRGAKLLPIKVSPQPIASTATGGAIEIELPCGARVRVNGEVSAERIVTVLQALAQR